MPPKGCKHTAETRRKISESHKGKRKSEEHRANLSAAHRGKKRGPLSAEHRANLSEAQKGRTFSAEHRANLSEAKKGTTLSAEHRVNIGSALKGKVKTPETRQRMSEWQRGIPHGPMSEEQKRKISEANMGREVTDEFRQKMSEIHKNRTAETRQRISESKMGHPVSEATRRKLREQRQGEKSPRWKGGISFEPYCGKFNEEFKERVREYFGRRCVECGASESGKRLSVHHVNFRKDSCCAEDAVPLFVPLCHSCHSKTNSNRDYWQARFTALINEQYGGQCYIPKECPNRSESSEADVDRSRAVLRT